MNIPEILGKKIKGQLKTVNKVEIIDCDNADVAPPFKKGISGNMTIYYEDDSHVYFVERNGKRVPLLSTTTIWGLLSPKFDEDFHADNCAKKPDYTCKFLNKKGWDELPHEKKVSRIKTAWHKNNKDATSYGTVAHAGMEYLVKHPELTPQQIMAELKYTYKKPHVRDVINSFLENHKPVIDKWIEDGFELVAEPVIGILSYGMAGQMDLGVIDHKTKSIYIEDYKTNKTRPGDEEVFDYMLPPFDNVPNTAFYHYCLQLSTYALMLLRHYPGYTVKTMTLRWLNGETGDVEPIPIPLFWIDTVHETLENMRQQGVFKQAYQIALK